MYFGNINRCSLTGVMSKGTFRKRPSAKKRGQSRVSQQICHKEHLPRWRNLIGDTFELSTATFRDVTGGLFGQSSLQVALLPEAPQMWASSVLIRMRTQWLRAIVKITPVYRYGDGENLRSLTSADLIPSLKYSP